MAKDKKIGKKSAPVVKKVAAKKAEKPPEPIAVPVKKQGRFSRPKKHVPCPGGCGGTGVKEGHPCEACRPTDYVAENRKKEGTCVHQEGEPGMCPRCLAATIVEGEPGRRGTTKGNRREVYQVYRDHNGIAYLRVRVTKDREAQFIVNKGFSVELITIDQNHAHSLDLEPVIGASIYEAARRLFTPLNDQVTISIGAREFLTEILSTKEIEMKATTKQTAVPTKTAKFATTQSVPAAPAKSAKKNAAAATEPEPAKKAAAKKAPAKSAAAPAAEESTGRRGRAGTFSPEQKIILVNKENPGREGTKRHEWYSLYKTSKTVGDYLEAGGDRGYLKFDVEKGNIDIK